MSSYYSVYSEHIGHRPRRSLWFGPWSVVAVALLAFGLGVLIATVAGAAARQGEVRPVNCLLRSPAADGFQLATLTSLTGVCRVER